MICQQALHAEQHGQEVSVASLTSCHESWFQMADFDFTAVSVADQRVHVYRLENRHPCIPRNDTGSNGGGVSSLHTLLSAMCVQEVSPFSAKLQGVIDEESLKSQFVEGVTAVECVVCVRKSSYTCLNYSATDTYSVPTISENWADGIIPFIDGHKSISLSASSFRASESHGNVSDDTVCNLHSPNFEFSRCDFTNTDPEQSTATLLHFCAMIGVFSDTLVVTQWSSWLRWSLVVWSVCLLTGVLSVGAAVGAFLLWLASVVWLLRWFSINENQGTARSRDTSETARYHVGYATYDVYCRIKLSYCVFV